jgi:DNA-3-methyladenine glycosylase I
MKRCEWAQKEVFHHYHDYEWGKPLHDDIKLFEALIIDGFQAGLSWEIILKKRENFRKAFFHWDARKISKFTEKDVERLLQDGGIIRNKMKIKAAIQNAKGFLEIQKEFGSFDKYLWGYVGNKPRDNKFSSIKDLPAKTELSERISKDLKKRGFNFVGPTIIYAFMQGVGMVNDHTKDCSFR